MAQARMGFVRDRGRERWGGWGGAPPNRRIVFTYRRKPITNDEITVPKKANVQIAPKFRKKCLCSMKFPYHILANQLKHNISTKFPKSSAPTTKCPI
jgi:hypothetical protein